MPPQAGTLPYPAHAQPHAAAPPPKANTHGPTTSSGSSRSRRTRFSPRLPSTKSNGPARMPTKENRYDPASPPPPVSQPVSPPVADPTPVAHTTAPSGPPGTTAAQPWSEGGGAGDYGDPNLNPNRTPFPPPHNPTLSPPMATPAAPPDPSYGMHAHRQPGGPPYGPTTADMRAYPGPTPAPTQGTLRPSSMPYYEGVGTPASAPALGSGTAADPMVLDDD